MLRQSQTGLAGVICCVKSTTSFYASFDGGKAASVNHSIFPDGHGTTLVGCTKAPRLINMADGQILAEARRKSNNQKGRSRAKSLFSKGIAIQILGAAHKLHA